MVYVFSGAAVILVGVTVYGCTINGSVSNYETGMDSPMDSTDDQSFPETVLHAIYVCACCCPQMMRAVLIFFLAGCKTSFQRANTRQKMPSKVAHSLPESETLPHAQRTESGRLQSIALDVLSA